MTEQLLSLYEKERRRLLTLTGDGDYAHPVFGEGPLGARLMLVGEAPGAEEAKTGHPFVGKAGKELQGLLDQAGILRAEVFVTNAVKYRPTRTKPKSVSNRTPLQGEVLEGLYLLERELLSVRPAIVATLGNTPLSAVLRLASLKNEKIGPVHGKRLSATISSHAFTLFPLYHPASIIYNRALTDTLAEDLRALNALLRSEEL